MLLAVLYFQIFTYSRLLFSETTKFIYHLELFAAKILFQMFAQFLPDSPHHKFRCSTAIFDFPAANFHSPTACFCHLVLFAAKILFQMFAQFLPDSPHHKFRCSTATFDFSAANFHLPTACFCLLIAFLHHPTAQLLHILHLRVAV
jgi:hypothetical protein